MKFQICAKVAIPFAPRFFSEKNAPIMAQSKAAQIYIAYAPEDTALKDSLVEHLSMLRRGGIIDAWHEERLSAGDDVQVVKSQWLNRADIVLLLLSADFLASDYLFDNEVKTALERHRRGETRLVPVILRDCLWQSGTLASLSPLPANGQAVTSGAWTSKDEAFRQVAAGIEKLVRGYSAGASDGPSFPPAEQPLPKGGGLPTRTLLFGGALALLALVFFLVFRSCGASNTDRTAQPSAGTADAQEQSPGPVAPPTDGQPLANGKPIVSLPAGTTVRLANGTASYRFEQALFDGQNVQVKFRAMYHGRYNMTLGSDNFRLIADDAKIAPLEFLAEVLDIEETKTVVFTFAVPAGAKNLALALTGSDETTIIPLTSEPKDLNQHEPYPLRLDRQEIAQPSWIKMLMKSTLVKTYNVENDELYFAFRATGIAKYGANFSNDNLRIQFDGESIKPSNSNIFLLDYQTTKDVEVTFIVPKTLKAATLLVINGDKTDRYPISW